MKSYSLKHLSDATLVRELKTHRARERSTTAAVLAHIAEFDERKLYLPAACPSMFEYCVRELGYSDPAAYKRIQAARAARQFPAIFGMLAEGRLNLTGVLLLAPHLTAANADELLQAAAGKRKAAVEELIARRFPRSESLPLVQPLGSGGQLAPERVATRGSDATQLAPERVVTLCTSSRLAPIAPERYALQLTLGKSAYDQLCYARALLGHQIPSGDLAEVLEKVIAIAVRQLEQRKFAATSRPRPRRPRSSDDPRHIPAAVKRAVWERDGGQCTFESESGHRCPARARLEFDHVEEVARGGQATVANLRLRCRAHNQYGAERRFGAGFMHEKREEAVAARAQASAAEDRAMAAAAEAERVEREAAAQRVRAAAEEVVPWVRSLGFKAEAARSAALAACEALPDASLERRLKLALSYFGRPPQRVN